jgi:hypothetical protein
MASLTSRQWIGRGVDQRLDHQTELLLCCTAWCVAGFLQANTAFPHYGEARSGAEEEQQQQFKFLDDQPRQKKSKCREKTRG